MGAAAVPMAMMGAAMLMQAMQKQPKAPKGPSDIYPAAPAFGGAPMTPPSPTQQQQLPAAAPGAMISPLLSPQLKSIVESPGLPETKPEPVKLPIDDMTIGRGMTIGV